ncbi:MAG: response regulator [Thermodesulfobacteriota bacterium]
MTDPADWKILLVDDEASIRKVTGIALQDAGYTVHTAEDGKAGLAACREFAPHIVITDIRMPKMGGLALLEAIKEEFADIEVIVVTAYGEMETAIRALQLDASDFITKPVDDDALHIAIDRAKKRYTDHKQLADYTQFLETGWNETTRELLEAFRFEKQLIESSMDGIVGCDETQTIVTFNRSMEVLTGYDRGVVIRKMGLPELFFEKDFRRFMRDMGADGYGGNNRLFLYETVLATASGQKLPVQASAAPLDQVPENAGLVLFFRDLRQIRQLEREVEDQAKILHQDKMMSLGRLAASVVHEINNPLAGILNYIRLMIKILSRKDIDSATKEQFGRYLEIVESETDRCSRIVSNLLTFSRKSPAQFSPVVVADLIQRCVLLSQHKLQLSNIELHHRVSDGLPAVYGDINQLQQCLINLIFNAIDAMPEGGRLDIEAFHDTAAAQVVITVADTGTGIAEADRPHIFEPFYTTKREGYGVGLGLSTVYGIAVHHNGTVDVDSAPGKGTTFSLRLPV